MNDYLEPIDHTARGFGDLYDELPLWSAPFGMMILDRIPLKPALTILDVGAGTGWLSVELAGRCGPAATVIAVDPWEAGLERLRRKIAQRGLRNVLVRHQDVATLDVPDESVDVIASNLGINNFDDPERALRACFRMARPDATLVITSNVIGHMAEFYEVFRATLVELGQQDRLPRLEAHIRHRGTVESIADVTSRAGFAVASRTTGSFRVRFADGSSLLRHHFVRLGFVQGWKTVPDEHRIEQTFHALEERLNARARERGELALTIPMACVVARKSTTP